MGCADEHSFTLYVVCTSGVAAGQGLKSKGITVFGLVLAGYICVLTITIIGLSFTITRDAEVWGLLR
jgi:hypothetical protein